MSVLFHLVTLPVEIDASRRAVQYLGTVSDVDQRGAKEVLTAAALTYVAAALTSILQLMYYMSAHEARSPPELRMAPTSRSRSARRWDWPKPR